MRTWALAITTLLLAALTHAEPAEVSLQTLTRTRAEISLNGSWRFMPALGPAQEQPTSDWGAIRVPGDWRNTPARPSLLTQGTGPAWAHFNPDALSLAWYERTFTVPSDWAGRAVLLDFHRLSTDALVFVNDRPCGRLTWPGNQGSLDITSAITPGQPATLRLLVAASPDSAHASKLLESPDTAPLASPSPLESRGLIGDVILRSRPKGPHIRDLFVQTSTREKLALLDIELGGLKEPGAVHIIARMLDPQGREEQRFERHVIVDGKDNQLIKAAWKWHNPRLWDFAQPNLYTCQVQVKGLGIDDEYAQQFGFREFWVEGRTFFLNGKELRLRPASPIDPLNISFAPETLAARFDTLLNAGFTIEQHSPILLNRRGIPSNRNLHADIADRKGFPLIGLTLPINDYIVGPNYRLTWEKDDARKKWESAMLADLKRLRNHPSILMWAFSTDFLPLPHNPNPRMLGQRDPSPADPWTTKAWDHSKEALAILRKYDPTRPAFNHNGGFVADLHAVNLNLALTPLQEQEEWPSHWAQHGQAPLFPLAALPSPLSFLRGRGPLAQTASTEPLLTEFAAIYLGPDAYRSESSIYRDEIKNKFLSDQQYSSWHNNQALQTLPAFQKLHHLFSTNLTRAWRTWGINPASTPPSLAWIAGPKDAFTSKAHNFTPGQAIRKQAILINDSRQPLPFSLTWSVSVNNQPLPNASASTSGTLAPSQTLSSPIEFSLPSALPSPESSLDAQIHLTATIGSTTHQDHFPFRIFPNTHPASSQPLPIFDPPGLTYKLLQQQNYALTPWKGQLDAPLVIIGREVLSRGLKLPADLEAYVRDGGRALVFTQHPDWARASLGLRVAQHLPRRAFPISTQHPVTAGLTPDDLRDWAGQSTLVEAKPDATKPDVKLAANEIPYFGWHWGNRGALSFCAIEKPHRAGWRPILECEFDLAYTPLMELDYGKGRVIWCTLDLEDHAPTDPAAATLLRQLVSYAATAPLRPRAKDTLLIGSDTDAAFLDTLSLLYRRDDKLDPNADLTLIGPDADVNSSDLESYLSAGGRLFFLPQRKPTGHLNTTIAQADNFAGALDVPAWPECAGLSPSDLRWRTNAPAWLLQSPSQVGANGLLARKTLGDGVALFCQIDPNALNADQNTYFRYTRWRQTRALTQILANLGATFALDQRFFQPKFPPEITSIDLDDKWRAQMVVTFPPAAPGKTLEDPGMSEEAAALLKPDLDHGQWQQIKMPAFHMPLYNADGEAVFRKSVNLPKAMTKKELLLSLGSITDSHDVFVNGTRIHKTDPNNPSLYIIPKDRMKEGRNIIAVRLWDSSGPAGFTGPATSLFLRTKDWKPAPSFYHPDYRPDFDLGDTPYRYSPQ